MGYKVGSLLELLALLSERCPWKDRLSIAYVEGGMSYCFTLSVWHTRDGIFSLKGVMIQGEIVITPGSME